MSLPHRITEAEFLAAVNHVSGILAAKHKFGNHDTDDVQQMVAVYALEALPRFEPAKGNLESFIYRHCSNRLLNLRRDELGYRSDAPCRVCYEHARGLGDGHLDGSTCPKFVRWWRRRQARVNLASPCSLDKVASLEQESRAWTDANVPDSTANKELLDLIDAHVPLDLRADFLRLRAGENLPKLQRERVYQAARDILDDPRQFESHGPNTTFEGLEPDDLFDDLDDDE